MKITAVRGMNDILPGEAARWQEIERVAREVFALYGYREIRTPIVERRVLFERGVGEGTDIVNKEMFEISGGDELEKAPELSREVLRPEGTAGVVRAFIEHGCHVEGPQKWFYMGPMFRRERPQKGRLRQFHQIGCEALGMAEPLVDAEQIILLSDIFRRLGATCGLKLNTVGDSNCRPAYLEELRAYLARHADQLCDDCKDRAQRNPLRVLDCKVESCQPVINDAPRLIDRLCPECRAHFQSVRDALERVGEPYEIDARLVRGLDYYVRTAYEFTSDLLGAQSAVAGGGRYDKLVETLGGPPTPGIGFALGQERLGIILEKLESAGVRGKPPETRPTVFLLSADERGAREALSLCTALRRAGIRCDLDPRGGKLKAQFKQAERAGARYALVLGGNEVASGEAKLKDMATREEIPVALADLARRLARGT